MNLAEKAKMVRREVIKFKTATGNGHLASSLSIIDILVSLYYDEKTFFPTRMTSCCTEKPMEALRLIQYWLI